jgi:hypothetical protein
MWFKGAVIALRGEPFGITSPKEEALWCDRERVGGRLITRNDDGYVGDRRFNQPIGSDTDVRATFRSLQTIA